MCFLHEKTRAAAAPRKPKNGAVSSPLNTEGEDIFFFSFFVRFVFDLGKFGKLIGNCSLLERERERERVWEIVFCFVFVFGYRMGWKERKLRCGFPYYGLYSFNSFINNWWLC